MKYFLILTFTVLLSNIGICQADITLNHAQEAFNKGAYKEAFQLYSACIEKDSTVIEYYEKKGLSAQRMGKLADAKQTFLHIVEVDSSHQMALSQLASLYEQENNPPKVIKYYTQLTKVFPDNAIFKRKLAQNYAKAGSLFDAFYSYREAYKLNPEDIYTVKGLSEIFLQNEQYTLADSLLVIGLNLDSTNIDFHQLIARSKYKQKQYDSTIYYLKKIEGQVDLSAYFNKLVGYSLIQIDSFEQSLFYLDRALTDEGSKEYVHYYLATAYESLENEEYAEHHYKKALEEGISPNVDNYHRSLAKIYNSNNNLKEAIPHYNDAYKYGKDPVILFYLARASDAYYKDKSIAINYYNKYAKSSNSNDEYKKYSKSRVRVLKEERHQSR